MALTRSGVAYNLDESPHRLEVPYENQTLVFVFSSDLYKQKFYERFVDNRRKIVDSLTRRFGFRVENDVLCDIRLYSSIEKRGFLILKDGERFVCQENITLNGGLVMRQSCGV